MRKIKLPNTYIYLEEYFKKLDNFHEKPKSCGLAISPATQRLGSNSTGYRKM